MSLSESEKIFRVALNHFAEIGAIRTRKLLETFGSAEAVWLAPLPELLEPALFSARILEAFADFRRQQDPFKLYQGVLQRGIQLSFLGDSDYPAQLAQIYDPPYVLYARGQAPPLSRCVAIVGTRQATAYGLKMAERFAEVLAAAGIVIVSGMALGIDGAAHQGALKSGTTIAVLGSGVDKPSPPSHRELYRRMIERGWVISELPPDQPPSQWTFPARNRIVSGLSQALIVIEAGLKSGTLITVDCANDQGREIFAMPGPLTSSQSQGTHALIQQGAHLLTHPQEVLEILGWQQALGRPAQKPAEGVSLRPQEVLMTLTNPEQTVYELLSEQAQHIDQIVDKMSDQLVDPSSEQVQQLFSILTILELKGLAEQLPGKLYKKTLQF